MKKTILIILPAMILAATSSVSAQKKLIITDKAQFLTGEIETILNDRLSNDSIELTSMIDTRRRCDYWFATLITEGSSSFEEDEAAVVAGTRAGAVSPASL